MIETTINQAIESGAEVQPASSDDIKLLMSKLGISQLPNSYYNFLRLTGRGMRCGFLQGHSCFLNELPMLRRWAEELLEEVDSTMQIPPNNLVFWMSQGYMFATIPIGEDDDPPVYYFTETHPCNHLTKIANSFSAFISSLERGDKDVFSPIGDYGSTATRTT